MTHHIYVFLMRRALWAASLLLITMPAHARAQAMEGPPQAPAEAPSSGIFGITAEIQYPKFTDGSLQSALKPGDAFSISASSYDILLHDTLFDGSTLGLPAALPLSGSFGRFTSGTLVVPPGVVDGTYSVTVHATSPLGNDVSVTVTILVDATPPEGTVEASFGATNDIPLDYVASVAGTYDGTGSAAIIAGGSVFSADADGSVRGRLPLDTHRIATIASPFTASLPLPALDPSWTRIGIELTLIDEAGNATAIRSVPFPLVKPGDVLIDHAQSGSIVAAPNYEPGDIPAGIGIPHTLIDSLPDGDYYAVVFFEGLNGCPTANYEINAFRANAYWGYGILGSSGLYSHSWSSAGGGCMQQFHINPSRADDWLWGALSVTGTSSAIADLNGIPAFAICATRAACDPITPNASIDSHPEPSAHAISSVLFLPGIKGSALYERNPLCLIPGDGCDVRLWLPLADAAAPLLDLDSEGKSLRTVYAREGGILSSAFGTSFYDSFARAMDARAAGTALGPKWEWQAGAYDWRLSLPDIVSRGMQDGARVYFEDATSTPYLEERLRALAASSPTGKITLVTHSNGGLVAKALLDRLGDEDATRLIDKVVFVGVPQGGAPRAIASLLYGEGEAIPQGGKLAGLVLSAAHARAFAENAPMAYHLLPSAMFLAAHLNLNYPLLAFEGGALLAPLRRAFGTRIDSWDALAAFALGHGDDRQQPAANDLSHAQVLNPSLLAYANQEHAQLDTWQPPPGVKVFEIGGTGVSTISGIDLYEQPLRDESGATTTISYRPLFRSDGDGTVPLASALMMPEGGSVSAYTVDLPAAGDDTHWYSHGNMLEVPEVEHLVARIIDGAEDARAPAGSNLTLMAAADASAEQYAFFLHGNALLTLIDSAGRRTSIGTEAALREIPGSQSGSVGNVSYILAPANGSYTLEITNSHDAYVTLDIETHQDDALVARSTIASIPLSERGTARLALGGNSAASSSLAIDSDGDGVVDARASAQQGATVFPSSMPTGDTNAAASPAAISTPSAPPMRMQPHYHEDVHAHELEAPQKEASSTLGNLAPMAFAKAKSSRNALLRSGSVHGTSTALRTETSVAHKHLSWWTRCIGFLERFWTHLRHWLLSATGR